MQAIFKLVFLLSLIFVSASAYGEEANDVAKLEAVCTSGDAVSCLDLSVLYLKGESVAQDMVKAAAFLQIACDGGQMDGCSLLGVLYKEGQGVAKDLAKAAELGRDPRKGVCGRRV